MSDIMSQLMKRPARKQAKAPVKSTVNVEQAGTFNIWYGKWTGEGKTRYKLEKAERRCNIAKDAGYTKAQQGSPFCLHFSRGACMKGHECSYWHRIPLPEDPESPSTDIFGRERHSQDRDDMGGVGSFERDNRTLYVGNVKAEPSEMYKIVEKHFSEWGEIEHINCLLTKSVAFVRYIRRSSAEFAREAMLGQSMESNEILNVRWATEDPNPRVKEAKKRRIELQMFETMEQKLPVIGDKGNVLDYEGYYTQPDNYAPPAKQARIERDEDESDLVASLRDASDSVYEGAGNTSSYGTEYNGWHWDGAQWVPAASYSQQYEGWQSDPSAAAAYSNWYYSQGYPQVDSVSPGQSKVDAGNKKADTVEEVKTSKESTYASDSKESVNIKNVEEEGEGDADNEEGLQKA
ncbi:Pre-mRNA-splicing factor [Gaertneriomyces sp. JEL0708]|nr:Pre-mRNA-splicing factor [Gaertneriomyces sp. JEL0708]